MHRGLTVQGLEIGGIWQKKLIIAEEWREIDKKALRS